MIFKNFMKKKGGVKKNLLTLILYSLLVTLIFVFDQSAFLNNTKSVLLSTLKPFFIVSEKSIFQLTKPFEWLISQQTTREELKELRAKRLNSVALGVQISELEEENTFLKQALELKETSTHEMIVGEIIGKSSEPEQNVIINIGEVDGVKKGSAVVYPKNYLVGKVVEVYNHFSRVSLITSPNVSIATEGQTSKTDALCQGRINHLEIEVIDYEKDLKEDEIFVTSGIDGHPSGLIVGYLTGITDDPVAVSRVGELETIVNINDLKKIIVLIENKND